MRGLPAFPKTLNFAWRISVLSVIAIGLVSAFTQTAAAEPGKPAKKDSPARTKPKSVEVTASVEPLAAKPGEVVTYSITAKLKPGWHIYKYAKTQEGNGPRNTKFDLFETAGFTAEGDWTASKPLIKKKEPAFPDLESVEFYQDEVTWTHQLKIPADAAPGPKTIRCQASYQVCDDKSCSFPGQWTVNDVTVDVIGEGGAPVAAAAPATAPEPKPAVEGAKPRKADSDPARRSKAAKLTASVAPNEAKPGETVTYSVTATIQPGYHIYQYGKPSPAPGPRLTQFDFFDPAGLTLSTDWKSSTKPIVKEEPAFNNMLVDYFEGEVTWTISLQVPKDAAPGSKTLRCQAGYQICDDNACSFPGQWTLNDVVLTILPGSPDAQAVATPAPADQTKPTDATPKIVEASATVPALVAPKKSLPAEAPKVVSAVEKTARQGIIPLMIASALGGLLALVMPCVWPMIPITVNFFVKQGQAKNGSGGTTGLAITYCLAIIGVFTLVGVFCSFFVSATALPRLANNPWLNFAVAGLFLAFGLSLLGLFEIRLPNFLLNATSQNEGRGGLIGVFFMAMTLTITSFTCTFPVVGGLLVMAAGGEFFYPIIGLATFSAVLAFPFFLLALAPGLLSKMPKSGDWMNSVKVIGGLIEIGAAFKFLNTAELAFVASSDAWINAQVVLTVWVVLSGVCGFYMLGFFRTDHDYEEPRIGAGRMLLGCFFLVTTLYFAPALFGRPPKGQIWNELVVGLLPPDAPSLSAQPVMIAANGGAGSASHETGEVKSTETDPEKAERQERKFHGVSWGLSLDQALEVAKAEKKPVLIDYTGVNCANCRKMEQTVFVLPEVAKLLGEFVTVSLYTDYVDIGSISREDRQRLAERNQERQIQMTNEATNPFYVIVTPEGQVVEAIGGYNRPEVFVDFLSKGLAKTKGESKLAQVDAK